MKAPKMIIFDYGHTLCRETDFDGDKGAAAVMERAVRNENNLSAKDLRDFSFALYEGIAGEARGIGIEIHNLISDKLMYDYLQIGFDLTPVQIERIFWENAAPGDPMPNIEKVLSYLKERGIRSGVISNISFSGENLAERINRLLPDNEFEFIIASSEYIYRKPNKILFELALRKARLPACDAWFCGDSTKHDVAGAVSAGIFPVWYHSEIECGYRDKSTDVRPACDHLYIRDWLELIAALESAR